MRNRDEEELWAVYEVVQGKQVGIRVMCQQSEWEALAASHPSLNVLVRDRIASESEAEKLARGKSGDARPKTGNATPDDGRHVIKRAADS